VATPVYEPAHRGCDNGRVTAPLLDGPLRLLAVHAHPDDESSKGAATMARYVREGVQVLVVSCTGGERGDVLNPALAADEAYMANYAHDIASVRRAEMERARDILGIEHVWLGFVDSGYPEGDPPPPLPEGCFALVPLEEASAPLVAIVREFRPHVIVTYDEQGGYPHPDHVKCHEVTIEAFEGAADPDRYPGTGEPWQALKLYYHQTFHKQRVQALHDSAVEAGIESPYGEWLEKWVDDPEHAKHLTTFVPCGEWFPVRDEALKAHASQVDPEGRWFAMPTELQQAAWPTEDYELARSLVDTTIPEDDLFAGVRSVVRTA
jgi:mycothiol S-conjugate amidase